MSDDNLLPAENDYSLDELSYIKQKFGLDQKQAEALKYIRDGVPLKNFADILSEEMWLRELLKDMEANQCKVCKKFSSAGRSKALQMFAEWAGLLGSNSKKKSKKTVTFDE